MKQIIRFSLMFFILATTACKKESDFPPVTIPSQDVPSVKVLAKRIVPGNTVPGAEFTKFEVDGECYVSLVGEAGKISGYANGKGGSSSVIISVPCKPQSSANVGDLQ